MKFDIKQKGRQSNRDRSLISLLKSAAIMASGTSTVFLPSDPNELCDRLKLLLQEKQAGNKSNITDEEFFAVLGIILHYKCISQNSKNKVYSNVL